MSERISSRSTPVGPPHWPSPIEAVRRVQEQPDAAGHAPETIPELICRAALRAPRQPAVVCGTTSLAWEDLLARASRLARVLQAHGVGTEVPVGLYLDRSVELITAMLGILLSGGAFVPLLPGDPVARVGQQVRESGLRIALTDSAHRGQLPSGVTEVFIDDPVLEALPGTPPMSKAAPDSLAYVLFTSGSTGTPKGVAVTLANLLHYVRSAAELVGLPLNGGCEPWHCATVSSLAADLGHTSIFLALCSGGVLHILPEETLLDVAGYQAWITRQPIDLLKITPSHFHALTGPGFAVEHLPRRWLVLGGEALAWNLVDRVLAAGRCRILNHYGPTETTVGVCAFEVRSGGRETPQGPVPIGRPLGHVLAKVLDDQLHPVPAGSPGELWIGGPSVSRGYLGRDELTRERFLELDGTRWYRTGDQVRQLPAGEFEFMGRFDGQVKIRGFRVEIGEIEAVLTGHPDVAVAAVVAPLDSTGHRELRGFVLPNRNGAAPSPEGLRVHLAQHLPSHMVPSPIVILSSLPLTPSGKVDRRALETLRVPSTSGGPEAARAYSTLEAVLIRIWERLLPGRAIGPTDDFFDLGGHSLLAARMVDEIAPVLGFALPLDVLFRGATVRDIARYAAQRVEAEKRAEIIEVQQGRSGVTPFFMVHGDHTAGGFYCRWLAEATGPDQPLFAIPPYVPSDADRALTIEAMAARFARLVRTAQPRGPYRLGGYCDGGLVAYELARRLRAEGEEVELVLLVDTELPNARHRVAYYLFSAYCRVAERDPVRRADLLGFLMERVWDVHGRSRRERMIYYAGLPLRWLKRRLHRQTDLALLTVTPGRSDTVRHHDRARFNYLPGRYDGRVELLWGAGGRRLPTVRDLGWLGTAGEVVLTVSPETHITVVTKALPGVLAAAIARLDGAAG